MHNTSRRFYHQHANQKWQDKCRVVEINQRLVALPYIEASKAPDYILGATIASIAANRLIRKLMAEAV